MNLLSLYFNELSSMFTTSCINNASVHLPFLVPFTHAGICMPTHTHTVGWEDMLMWFILSGFLAVQYFFSLNTCLALMKLSLHDECQAKLLFVNSFILARCK